MIQLQKTRTDFEGNLTLVAFPLLKTSRKKPEDTAQEMGAYLKAHCKAVADFNVVKRISQPCDSSSSMGGAAQRHQCRREVRRKESDGRQSVGNGGVFFTQYQQAAPFRTRPQ